MIDVPRPEKIQLKILQKKAVQLCGVEPGRKVAAGPAQQIESEVIVSVDDSHLGRVVYSIRDGERLFDRQQDVGAPENGVFEVFHHAADREVVLADVQRPSRCRLVSEDSPGEPAGQNDVARGLHGGSG